MNMNTLEEIIKSEGWALYTQKRWNQHYVYATRRRGKSVLKAYIAPVARIETLTEQQVQQKLREAYSKPDKKKA